MCVMLHKPAKAKLSEDIYKECFRCNQDGGGVAFVKDGKIVVEKGFSKASEMIKFIQSVEPCEMIIHFRAASPGMVINEENCHPFVHTLKSNPAISFAVMHNGRLPWRSTPTWSDTAMYCKERLFPLLEIDPDFLEDELKRDILSESIGKGNKLLVLRLDSTTGESSIQIVNEAAGNIYKKCWFSNYSYLPPKKSLGFYSGDKDLWDQEDWEDYRAKTASNISQPGYSYPKDNAGTPYSAGGTVVINGRTVYSWNVLGWWFNKATDMWERKVGDVWITDKAPYELTGDQMKSGNVFPKPQITSGTNGKVIEVPRDADKAKPSEDKKGDDLRHLGKQDRVTLRRYCADYCKSKGDMEAKFTPSEALAWTRSDYKEALPVLKNFDNEQIDQWITVQIGSLGNSIVPEDFINQARPITEEDVKVDLQLSASTK